jgi:ankyrin repeat protein
MRSMTRAVRFLALFPGLCLLGAPAAWSGGSLRLAQIAPSEAELRIYAGLHAAAAEGDAAAIERLIAAGEKPNLQDSRSRTPLHVAAFFGQHEATRTLIRLGANPNARERQRFDVLTIAAVAGDLEMVDILLAAGADPRAIVGPYDSTALIDAAHLGHVAIVERLIAARAPLDHFNALGFTALIEAVVLGNGSAAHGSVVAALARAGADVNLTDRQGMTALAHAEARGYRDMARVLAATEPRPTRGP